MSGNKQATSFGRDSRRSPVGNRKSKISKAEKTMPLSNGLQEVIPGPNTSNRVHHSGSLGHEEVLKMNLLTVQKLDTSVVRIESTVPQVVLYQYEASSNTWVRYTLLCFTVLYTIFHIDSASIVKCLCLYENIFDIERLKMC